MARATRPSGYAARARLERRSCVYARELRSARTLGCSRHVLGVQGDALLLHIGGGLD